MNTLEQYQQIRNNHDIQLYIYVNLGRFARDYVITRYPEALALYVTNDNGIRTHVGIFDTQGLEITAKHNFCKEQYPLRQLGRLVTWSATHTDSPISKLNTFAWISAVDAIRTDQEEMWYFDWLKALQRC